MTRHLNRRPNVIHFKTPYPDTSSTGARGTSIASDRPPFDGAGTRERVLSESPRERTLAGHLLRVDKRVDGDGNGPVHVQRRAVLGETHLRKGFAGADDCLKVADLFSLRQG